MVTFTGGRPMMLAPTVPDTLWLAGGVNEAAIEPETIATATELCATVMTEPVVTPATENGTVPWKATTDPEFGTYAID